MWSWSVKHHWMRTHSIPPIEHSFSLFYRGHILQGGCCDTANVNCSSRIQLNLLLGERERVGQRRGWERPEQRIYSNTFGKGMGERLARESATRYLVCWYLTELR
jgi:hypothetical protein